VSKDLQLAGTHRRSEETAARDRGTRYGLDVAMLAEYEEMLQERLDAVGALRAELLHVLMLPDFERAGRIGQSYGYPESRASAELLIDCEEDRTFRRCSSGCCARLDR
jgi:hypothetical protein